MKEPIAQDANRDRTPTCQFCGAALVVIEFHSDRYGGHWTTEGCDCATVREVRASGEAFRRALRGR
jgi:hypothetical protein